MLSGLLMALLPSLGELAANVATYGRAATETPQPLRDAGGAIVFPGCDADLLYSFAAQVLMWGVLAERVAARADGQDVEAGETPETTGA